MKQPGDRWRVWITHGHSSGTTICRDQEVLPSDRFQQKKRAECEDPAIATDAPRLLTANAELEAAQKALDALCARWAELEGAGNLPDLRHR